MIHREAWYREAAMEDELARLHRGLAEGQVSPLEFVRKWERARPGTVPPLTMEQFLTLPPEYHPTVEQILTLPPEYHPSFEVTEVYHSTPEGLPEQGSEELADTKTHRDSPETISLEPLVEKLKGRWSEHLSGPYPALFNDMLVLDTFPEHEQFALAGVDFSEEEEAAFEDEFWQYRNFSELEIKFPSRDLLGDLARYVGVENLES